MYQNLSIIVIYVPRKKKVNKFLQLNICLFFLGSFRYTWKRNGKEPVKCGLRIKYKSSSSCIQLLLPQYRSLSDRH